MKLNLKKACLLLAFSMSIFFASYYYYSSNYDGVKYLKVVDGNNKELRDILVVQIYSESIGIGVGPDGTGPNMSSKLKLANPFIFHSGEDLMLKKRIHTKGVLFPPFIFIGRGVDEKVFVFIKKGYKPKFLSREHIYSDMPIMMTKSDTNDYLYLINLITIYRPDQIKLKKALLIDWMKNDKIIGLTDQDIEDVASEYFKNNKYDIFISLSKSDIDMVNSYK